MAKIGDQDSQREHSPNTARISQMLFESPIKSEQNSPENQTADEQQLDQPGDADGFLQSSVNRGGIPQLTPLNLGQRGASNSIDQGREQPPALMQQQPDTSRGKKRKQQQSAPDSHSPAIRQTILGDKLARKRLNDKRYRDRIRLDRLQTKADLEKLCTEYRQLDREYQKMKSDVEKFGAEYQKMKSDVEKFGAENGQLKDEYRELKSEVEKLKAENGQLTLECQGMRSYGVEFEAENRYSSRKNNDTFRSFIQGSGPPQSSTSGFQDVGPFVQPPNINPFDDWSHNRDNGVDEYITVEGICIRSHEMLENEDRQLMPQPFSMGDHAPINMPQDGFQNEDMQLNRSHEVLENEDMQHMPQLFGMEGHASMNMPEDWYTFCSYIPSPMSRSDELLENEEVQFMSCLFSMEGQASINMTEDGCTPRPYIPSPMPNFGEDCSRPGKAVVEFLKIKAAMRWGFFIRKKAAERRAQIVKLEEVEL